MIRRLLAIFTCGFVIPQIVNIYINGLYYEAKMPARDVILQLILYLLCGTTQFFFLTLEYGW